MRRRHQKLLNRPNYDLKRDVSDSRVWAINARDAFATKS